MPLRICSVCGCETNAEWGESRMKGHPHCPRCGLLFGDGHIVEETKSGLCWLCFNEDISEEVNLDTEDHVLKEGSNG